MGLNELALDCDCCGGVVDGKWCMSVAIASGATQFWNPAHTGKIGVNPLTQPAGYNRAYLSHGYSVNFTNPIQNATPPLEDPGYEYFERIGNNPDFWEDPPANCPNFNPTPTNLWGGWVWCPNGISCYHKAYDNPSYFRSNKYYCPLWFPLEANEDGSLSGDLCGPQQNGLSSYRFEFGCSATGSLGGPFTRNVRAEGVGMLQDHSTKEPYSRSWFDYLSEQADIDFKKPFDLLLPKPRGHQYSFRARTNIMALSIANKWAIGYNPPDRSGIIEPTHIARLANGIPLGVTHSFELTSFFTDSVEEAIQNAIQMAGEPLPFGDVAEHAIHTTSAPIESGACSTWVRSEWVNIDEWLKSLSPATGLFIAIKMSPENGVKPPILSFDTPIHVNIPGHPNHGGVHREFWQHAYNVRADGMIEIEVQDLDDGKVGQVYLGGKGQWVAGEPGDSWSPSGTFRNCPQI